MSELLKSYQKKIDQVLAEEVSSFGPDSPAKKGCEYSLLNGGKRFRPIITLMVADALNLGADVMQAALATEYFHTASLVADDLPCMDDDDERRQKPSLHKIYGEALSLLVTYALIAEGYSNYTKNAASLKTANLAHSPLSDRICTLTIETATYNTGLNGATGGQLLDIMPPDLSLETVKQVIHKKTSSLFEIAFVSGWLFGGGQIRKLDLVKDAAAHYGLAFQIADDIGDQEQDLKNGRKINVANLFGIEAATKMIESEVAAYKETVSKLNIATPPLEEIATSLLIGSQTCQN
ncbi:MAG: polyprenyl synthetase family protein [Chlamydiota bacterium]